MRNILFTITAAAALAGCNSSASGDLNAADASEMADLRAWAKQVKAEDPDTMRLLVRQCMGAGSFFSDEGKLQIARCMKQKYDAGALA